jgi:hypothetical protein
MGTFRRTLEASGWLAIALALCLGCSSSASQPVKDAGPDQRQPMIADSSPDQNRVSATDDASAATEIAARDATDLLPPDAPLSPSDTLVVDQRPGDLPSLDLAALDSARDAPAADLLDAAIEGPGVDGARRDQAGIVLDAGALDGVAEAGRVPMADPFAGVELKPDTDTTPVASCTGQPDMTLCKVVTTPDRWYDICVGGTCVSPGCDDTSCNAPAPHFPIPANSNHSHLQIVSSGAEPVVADLVTGLHWQGCDGGRSGDGCSTGTSKEMGWSEAIAYCDALRWGDKDDWYLPDSYEVMSIFDIVKSGDTGVRIDPAVFPHSSWAYWSSHRAAGSTVLGIQFRFGDPIVLTDGGPFLVRCVRRGSSRNAAYVGTRFTSSTVDGQKLISDPATGMVWQGRHTAVLPMAKWLDHCDSLSWGGFNDWRLPTYKELYGIAQLPPFVNTADPRIDDKIFDVGNSYGVGACSGWQQGAFMFLYNVRDATPSFLDLVPSYSFPVLCVRGL